MCSLINTDCFSLILYEFKPKVFLYKIKQNAKLFFLPSEWIDKKFYPW